MCFFLLPIKTITSATNTHTHTHKPRKTSKKTMEKSSIEIVTQQIIVWNVPQVRVGKPKGVAWMNKYVRACMVYLTNQWNKQFPKYFLSWRPHKQRKLSVLVNSTAKGILKYQCAYHDGCCENGIPTLELVSNMLFYVASIMALDEDSPLFASHNNLRILLTGRASVFTSYERQKFQRIPTLFDWQSPCPKLNLHNKQSQYKTKKRKRNG